jgi:chemotaxis protein methyltransferase CheR
MYLLEFWPGIRQWDVEIISSDIDTGIIAQARRGYYSPRSVHRLPQWLLSKYFTVRGEGYQLSNEIRDAVEFTRVNLNSQADVRSYRNFDIIFCRNLLIYFDDLSRRQAADTFYDALRPGGFICLGHSEFPETIVYQKPKEGR